MSKIKLWPWPESYENLPGGIQRLCGDCFFDNDFLSMECPAVYGSKLICSDEKIIWKTEPNEKTPIEIDVEE